MKKTKFKLLLPLLFVSLILAAQDYRTAKEMGLMEGFPPPEDKRITAANALLFPPYNRWSYQHMRMFYPTAPIKNSDKSIKLTKVINNGINSLMIEKATADGKPAGEKVHIDTWLKETYTDAIIVVKGNVIVYEAFLNGMTANSPHQMMSVTKSFAGLFGLLAVEEGKITEETVVGSIIPELSNSGAFGDATFGQVLDMSNSMDFTEVYDDPESGIRYYGVVLGMMEADPSKTYAQSIYEYLPTLQKDPALNHGDIFNYQTPKTDVVNWVTNRATGADFQDNMYNYLWSKLGTDGETYVLLDKNATLFAGGGLNATPYDLARFAMAMVNNGAFNGSQVISYPAIKKISEGASKEAFSKSPDSKGIQGGGDWSYRAQWWVRHTPGKEAFTAMGVHGQYIYIDLERNVAIVKQSSQPESSVAGMTAYDIHGFDTIIEYLTQ